jgi:hypothetical protein
VGFVSEEKANTDVSAATAAMSIDPLCEKYYWISPYAYCLNNPVRYVDSDGRNPAVVIGGIAFSAVDLLLIGTGVVTSGVILHQTQSGGIAINANVSKAISGMFVNTNKNVISKLPGKLSRSDDARASTKEGLNNQRKNDKKATDKQNQREADVAKSIDTNISGDMPNGDPSPKRDPNDGGKKTKAAIAIVGAGAGIASVESIIEGTQPPKNVPITEEQKPKETEEQKKQK